jgi:hypothetical protein
MLVKMYGILTESVGDTMVERERGRKTHLEEEESMLASDCVQVEFTLMMSTVSASRMPARPGAVCFHGMLWNMCKARVSALLSALLSARWSQNLSLRESAATSIRGYDEVLRLCG